MLDLALRLDISIDLLASILGSLFVFGIWLSMLGNLGLWFIWFLDGLWFSENLTRYGEGDILALLNYLLLIFIKSFLLSGVIFLLAWFNGFLPLLASGLLVRDSSTYVFLIFLANFLATWYYLINWTSFFSNESFICLNLSL